MRARAAAAASAQIAGGSQDALIGRLRRMADEVEQLQLEIAAVEAFVTEPEPRSEPAAPAPVRPGAGWTPSPTPQPWLAARSA